MQYNSQEVLEMNKIEMASIDREISYIGERLKVLSPHNPIENQQRERLLCRLDFLEYKIDYFLTSKQKSQLRVISL